MSEVSSDWLAAYPWLKEAVELEQDGRDDLGLQMVYMHMEDWLNRGEYEKVDRLLGRCEPDELSIDILLALLTVTLRFNSRLQSRHGFFQRVRDSFRVGLHRINERGLLEGLG